ncbi:hypothetical protein M422DRAFT_30680 [Sphaerobolus stellatus SS14]|uniref:Uncharacterized protein n=1 Tax=Sphaerobolus stellatus (strain SS14) TaxID=990650 RepID=A0A0C9VZ17_SPHS4|nr:hypothetical protein M422DRAFT_30680 [Sphaerobolus stellatus SS14]
MEARVPSSLPVPSHPRRPSFSLSPLDSTRHTPMLPPSSNAREDNAAMPSAFVCEE